MPSIAQKLRIQKLLFHIMLKRKFCITVKRNDDDKHQLNLKKWNIYHRYASGFCPASEHSYEEWRMFLGYTTEDNRKPNEPQISRAEFLKLHGRPETPETPVKRQKVTIVKTEPWITRLNIVKTREHAIATLRSFKAYLETDGIPLNRKTYADAIRALPWDTHISRACLAFLV